MKKNYFAICLSTLLVANIVACRPVHETEVTLFTGSTYNHKAETNGEQPAKNSEEKHSELMKDCQAACDGILQGSDIRYTITPNNEIILYIEAWSEQHRISSLDEEAYLFDASKLTGAVNDDYGVLVNGNTPGEINICRFLKGIDEETIIRIPIDASICIYELHCNFVNKQTGYIFAFNESGGFYPSGHLELAVFLKTEDGGITWDSVDIQNTPIINLKEHVVFAKMIDKSVGIISGRYYADDFSFCRRNYLTCDGGVNWVQIPKLPEMDSYSGIQVCDFRKEEHTYLLTVQYMVSEFENGFAQYISSDLENWTLIE